MRRVEALTGALAVEAAQALEDELGRAAAALKAGRGEVADKCEKVVAALKESERQVETL